MNIGDETIEMTVEELSDRIAAGTAAWLLHGRGAEGMSMAELRAALRRQVPARWLAAFCKDVDYGLAALRSYDHEFLANRFSEGEDDEDGDEQIWTLPDAA